MIPIERVYVSWSSAGGVIVYFLGDKLGYKRHIPKQSDTVVMRRKLDVALRQLNKVFSVDKYGHPLEREHDMLFTKYAAALDSGEFPKLNKPDYKTMIKEFNGVKA